MRELERIKNRGLGVRIELIREVKYVGGGVAVPILVLKNKAQ